MSVLQILLVLVGIMRSKALLSSAWDVASHDYANALSKSILFFEGQRSGKLPPSQRMTWRKDSALRDGFEIGVDLVGGYYDAGDNLKFNFPMAFSATMLAWSVIEFGDSMGSDELPRALQAVRWATDYLLKATSVPGLVFVQVGEPYGDHNCWERPEDMDTPRTPYAVSKHFPGSEVAAETSAALAAASIAFRASHPAYSAKLLRRAKKVFNFADKYRGSYNDSLGPWVCPFYCDFSGYQDELLWGAAWLFKATNNKKYWNYVTKDTDILDNNIVLTNKDGSVVAPSGGRAFEFGWDSKHGGINVLLSKFVLSETPSNYAPFGTNSDKLICSLLPESPAGSVSYSPGGLLFKPGGSNLQHATAMSFLLIAYSRYLNEANRSIIQCDNFSTTPSRLIQVAKTQVDYILGNNPMKMSYMVGYGKKYPKRIHHRGSTLPSKDQYKGFLGCHDGTPYFNSIKPNHNVLVGAVVGGPDFNDYYADSRADFGQSEPTTYINAPLVGVLAYFKSHPY